MLVGLLDEGEKEWAPDKFERVWGQVVIDSQAAVPHSWSVETVLLLLCWWTDVERTEPVCERETYRPENK